MLLLKSVKIVFVKYPEEGKVKTRLAQETSLAFAAGIYRLMLNRLKALFNPYDNLIYFIDRAEKLKDFTKIAGGYQVEAQKGNDLGEKMYNAFFYVFNHYDYDSAVLIGSDIPGISKDILFDAERSLLSGNFTLGPSEDGGYYLIGIQKGYLNKSIFTGIKWSNSSVFSETVKRIEKIGTLSILKKLRDIDTLNDLMVEARSDNELRSYIKENL